MLLDELDEIALRRQQEDDAAPVECGGGDGFANRHTPPLPATCNLPVQVINFVTQMIHPTTVAADDAVDRAVLAKRLDQLDYRVALHVGETDRHSLDGVGDLLAYRERRENGAEEVFDVAVDTTGGIPHMVKAHRPASRYRVTALRKA